MELHKLRFMAISDEANVLGTFLMMLKIILFSRIL